MQSIDLSKRKLLKVMTGACVFASALFCGACTKKVTAKINHKKCIQCGLCESVCEYGAISYKNDKMKIDVSKCTGCAKCVSACVYDAIKV